MAKKFYNIDEAAEMLGISAEALSDMRGRNEIRGFRDGPTWKFKLDEIERVAKTLPEQGNSGNDSAEDAIGGDHPSDDEGSVLLSERELGAMVASSPGTVIGDSPSPGDEPSDLSLAESDIGLGEETAESTGDDPPMSDVRLAGGSDVLGGGEAAVSDLGLQFEELDSLELDFDGMSDSDAPADDDEKTTESAAADDLSLTGESDASLVDEDATETEDSVDLGGDDELVLGGAGSGSDVTTRPSESGISLMDPSDSGLSLEEVPLELGGSSIVSSDALMMDEDDMLTLGDDGEGSAISSEPQRDFDLNIEEEAEEASESGSQVIALDAEEAFDPEAATMIGGAFAGDAAAMLEPDTEADEPESPEMGVVAQPVSAAFVSPSLPEAPYSIWNVLALTVCILILGLCGVMMFDMVRNIWSWDQSYQVNSTLMDWITKTLSGK